jgi:hypothetical protein
MQQAQAEKVAWGRIVIVRQGSHKGEIFEVRRVDYGLARLRPWPDGGQIILVNEKWLEVLARA